jgi:hypothetical protein
MYMVTCVSMTPAPMPVAWLYSSSSAAPGPPLPPAPCCSASLGQTHQSPLPLSGQLLLALSQTPGGSSQCHPAGHTGSTGSGGAQQTKAGQAQQSSVAYRQAGLIPSSCMVHAAHLVLQMHCRSRLHVLQLEACLVYTCTCCCSGACGHSTSAQLVYVQQHAEWR